MCNSNRVARLQGIGCSSACVGEWVLEYVRVRRIEKRSTSLDVAEERECVIATKERGADLPEPAVRLANLEGG